MFIFSFRKRTLFIESQRLQVLSILKWPLKAHWTKRCKEKSEQIKLKLSSKMKTADAVLDCG